MKNKKNSRNKNSRKKWDKIVEGIKNWTVQYKRFQKISKRFKISTKMNKLIKTTKSMIKPVVSTTLNSLALNESKKKCYVSMGKKCCLLLTSPQSHIRISLLTMKTKTNTGENQKFKRKVREESVKAI